MNKQNASEFYNNFAPTYDTATINSWTAPEHIESVTWGIADKETNILDIGIGTGQSIQRVYSSGHFNSIEGIDTSENMLTICQQKYPLATLHHGDFLTYGYFKKSQFDLIICCGALEFITDLNLFFQKSKEVLSSKGNLVLTFEPRIAGHKIQSLPISNVHSARAGNVDDFFTYRHDIDEFAAIAESNGFKILKNQLFVAYRNVDADVIYSLIQMTVKSNFVLEDMNEIISVA